MSAVCSFFQRLSTSAFIFILLHFLYSIILCNFSSSHSPTGLQMLNPALIPKQQEFLCPNSLTHKITFQLPPPNHISFFSNILTTKQKKKQREKQFPIIALLNINLHPFCNQNVGICARTEMSSKITRTTQKSRISRDSPLH